MSLGRNNAHLGRGSVDALLPDRKFRVLATCRSFEPGFKGGGPIRSLAYIIDTVGERVDATLVTRDQDLGDRQAYSGLSGRWVRRAASSVFYLNPRSIRQLIELVGWARRKRPDLLYVNSLFDFMFSIVPIAAAKLHIIPAHRILVAPRGELAAGALSIKSTKKALFLKLWLPVLDDRRVIWHATSEAEASEITRVVPGARIELCADYGAVPPPSPMDHASGDVAKFVFVSRIAPVKNLDLALRALATLTLPVEFDIYGPVEDEEHWRACTGLMDSVPENVSVTYRGELPHAHVRAVFAGSDCFLFPTRGESYGHVIAESLSASCPVICSDKTPWTSVLAAGGGEVVRSLDERTLAAAIEAVAAASAAQRNRMREAAGLAFQQWRADFAVNNILEQVALRPTRRSRSRTATRPGGSTCR
jgi:glycosyltransferase involved in cell wall biosynthesis